MHVLIACEYSGRVREAFRKLGHNAWSCDLLPSEDNSEFHIQGDIKQVIEYKAHWDLLIAHPPCTHLAVSGARWFKHKQEEQKEALAFVNYLMWAPIRRICIENPISIISSKIKKPSQIIQPYEFGHPEFKKTCLWLTNLPKLKGTEFIEPPSKGDEDWNSWNKIHRMSPSEDRWKERSRTYQGIADAMAQQWGVF